jgi:phosphoribosylformylglycinamidine synthase
LGGSEYYKTLYGLVQGQPPAVHIEDEYSTAMAVLDLIREDSEGYVTAVHDCSAGGLGVALSEMIISGDQGAMINLSQIPMSESGLKDFEILFSESHGRYIITVKEDALNKILSKIKVPCAVIGAVGGNSLIIEDASVIIPNVELKKAFQGVIEKFMA